VKRIVLSAAMGTVSVLTVMGTAKLAALVIGDGDVLLFTLAILAWQLACRAVNWILPPEESA
jgi:hypothetical protein